MVHRSGKNGELAKQDSRSEMAFAQQNIDAIVGLPWVTKADRDALREFERACAHRK